jgi:hypothetical protein
MMLLPSALIVAGCFLVVSRIIHWYDPPREAPPWRRRPPPGHCRACGYNLKGNISGVCPECGEAVR